MSVEQGNATAVQKEVAGSPHGQPMTKNDQSYFPAFDYLRICLALVVVAYHAEIISWGHAGNLAVQIFFALSGWLIGGILLKSKTSDIPRFYFNRAARIWIPYFVALAVLIGASLLKDRTFSPKWYEFVFYMVTFVYNFFGITQDATGAPLTGTGGYLWSICAEEQFYLLAPILIVALPFGRSPWTWAALSAVALLSPFSIIFAAITLGVLAAVATERLGFWHNRPEAVLLLSVVALGLTYSTYYEFLDYSLVAPLIGVCVVLVFARLGPKTSAVGQFLGGVSYPLYLNHWLGIRLVTMTTNHFGLEISPISRTAMIAVAFAISSLLYLMVDVQIRKYRDRFFTRDRGQFLAFIAAGLVAIGLFGGVVIFKAPMTQQVSATQEFK